jgi:hypothetical protein
MAPASSLKGRLLKFGKIQIVDVILESCAVGLGPRESVLLQTLQNSSALGSLPGGPWSRRKESLDKKTKQRMGGRKRKAIQKRPSRHPWPTFSPQFCLNPLLFSAGGLTHFIPHPAAFISASFSL